MTVHREIELKLEVAPEDAERLRSISPLASASHSEEHQHSIYFDTPRRKLQKAGFMLRVRQSGEGMVQTVKSARNGAGLFEREEWEAPVQTMAPDLEAACRTPLAKVLTPKLQDQIEPLAAIQVDRTTWALSDDDDRIEVTFDHGEVSAEEARRSFNELELELKGGSRKSLFSLCEQLGAGVPLRLSVLSKADRALAIADGTVDQVKKAQRIDLTQNMSVAEGLTAIVMSCLQHFRWNEGIVAKERNPEALHQLRVAMRRLRSAFDLFRPVLRKSRRFRLLSDDLRWASRTLGEARNLDVFLMLLERGSMADEQVERQREESYDRVVAMLGSPRFLGMMLTLVRWLFIGKWRERAACQVPLGRFATRRLQKEWVRLADERSLSAMREKQRHRFRLRTKKFRYALEFVRSLNLGAKREAKPFHAGLEALQEELGQLNDMVIAKRLAAASGISAEGLIDMRARAGILEGIDRRYADLLAIGPYWLTDAPRRPEAAAARRQDATKPPAASRTRGPRSGGSAPG